jgi:hypothetical protein
MTDNLALLVLLAGMAFLAGAAITLIASERSYSARQRRQALRERELAEVSAFINDRLAVLARDTVPPDRGGP